MLLELAHELVGGLLAGARTTEPRSGSGEATAAVSVSAVCETSADSTSNGPIRYPEERIRSSLRPSNQR